ncbi:uncharacterized protein [Prorops nasuta]|uniref:uncharacterized protein n=1 Tax=Prorops nasuta TaxID=863751 RepID=UPI0034CF8AE2
MKITLFTLVALGLIAIGRSTDDEYYEYEEESAPVTPAPAKPAAPPRLGGLLSPRGRPPAVAARKPQAPTTTAKPIEQPIETDERGDETFDENQEQEEQVTTTTENPKKIRAGVRPFRSNEDLLAALKRRRAQAGSSSHTKESSSTHAPTEHTTTKSNKSATNNRNKNPSAGSDASSRTSSRRFGNANAKSKPVTEEVEETQREEVQVKAKPYRRG